MFPTGVSALYIDWGDGGPFSIDPNISVVQNNVGFGILPGATEYWDYVKGEWVTPESGINEAPFLAFGRLGHRGFGRQRRQGSRLRS